MNERWVWVVRYVVVILLALILAAVLGEMELFKTTRFGKTFNAARVAQFLGYGGALLVFWLLARRAAGAISPQDERWKLVRSIVVPLATLIVVACAHAVLLLILAPLMSKTWLPAYNWTFIGAIMLSAAWLVGALFTGSSSLEPLFGSARAARRREQLENRA